MKDFLGLGDSDADYMEEQEKLCEVSGPHSAGCIPRSPTDNKNAVARCPVLHSQSFHSPLLNDSGIRCMGSSMENLHFHCKSKESWANAPETYRMDANLRPTSEQLTIFYRGLVNVYSNVTPERAEAIMNLAGDQKPLAPGISNPHLGSLNMFNAADRSPSTAATQNFSVNAQMWSPIHFEADEVCQNWIPADVGCRSSTFKSISGHIGEPSFSEALPTARKASLVRFLKRRRKRYNDGLFPEMCHDFR
ncbi:hypothetical protein KP509_28G066000 [Ceratopteris richardii]|uniref:Tify domain-containing protein n=2 Tax=Ceratopteris richardii TaxID=49495 RepID=A0A8T2RCZ1_CERRI|nr:hypothetical protein KP509_28G066000 [Ceratopteris richardii]